MSEYTNNNGYELDWNAEIENEGTPFVVAEPGDYDFTVTGFERARFGGSAKMPPCNQAQLTIQIHIPGEANPCTIKHNLFLHSKTEWKLCEFFTSIGQRKHGERVSMNWNAVLGASGRCKVSKRSFPSKNDPSKTMWANDIEKFYEPATNTAPATAAPAYTQQNYVQPQQQSFAGTGYTVGKF